jgi:hypothetical protein
MPLRAPHRAVYSFFLAARLVVLEQTAGVIGGDRERVRLLLLVQHEQFAGRGGGAEYPHHPLQMEVAPTGLEMLLELRSQDSRAQAPCAS